MKATAARFKKGGAALKSGRAGALVKCAVVAQRTLLEIPGAPKRVRNMRNAATTVKFKVAGDTAHVGWVGPAHIVNNATSAHFITPRGTGSAKRMKSGRYTRRAARLAFGLGGGGKGAGQHALLMPGGEFRSWSHTRGTKGKHFFEKGVAVASVTVPKAYHSAYLQSLEEAF